MGFGLFRLVPDENEETSSAALHSYAKQCAGLYSYLISEG